MKIFKIILILLLSLLGIVIIGGGILVILVYDNSFKENPYQDYNNDLDYEVNSLISNAIKDTKETKTVDASIDEERINYLLQALINTLNKEFGNEVNVKGANVEIKENDSTLISIHFNVLGFPSSLKGDFTLKDDNNTIYFQINNASIGKINASRNTMGSLATLFIRDKEIQKELEKKGIKIDVNVHQLKVSLNKDEVPGMINDMLKDDPNNELYAALVDIVFENELIKIIATNHELGADAYLTKLAYDSTKFYDIPYNFDYEDIKSKTEQLLNNNIIDYKNCGLVFDYLVRGYERVTIGVEPDNISTPVQIKEFREQISQFEPDCVIVEPSLTKRQRTVLGMDNYNLQKTDAFGWNIHNGASHFYRMMMWNIQQLKKCTKK